MAYRWPAGTTCKRIALAVEDRSCPVCHRYRPVCDHRYQALWTFAGPPQVVNRLGRGPDTSCQRRGRTGSPDAELSSSRPRWGLGWDVWCWLGHRRLARHWSVPPRRLALKDTHQSALSGDASAHSSGLYQTRRAARPQAPDRLTEADRDIASLGLTLDGLHPEKGPETLDVVRARKSKRVWFAEPLRARAEPEGRRLIVLARQGAERLAKPGRVWRSDQPEAFVKAIAEEFSGPPPRYGPTHFRRALAQPGLERESRAQVKMRRQVRGWRAIERRVLAERRPTPAPAPTAQPERAKTAARPRTNRPAVAAPPRAAPPEPWAASA